ncbi:MAG: hypothetical protein ACREMZ_15600 [Gemmatimonadales bacterium]
MDYRKAIFLAVTSLVAAACHDTTTPTDPADRPDLRLQAPEGRYTYQQLDPWFRAVSFEALAHAGVVFVDLDEAANRVYVGVENAAGAAAVQGVVARLGVPAGAVTIQETEPIHYVETLRDKVRPLVGGLQIRFSNFLCSLGYNAERAGVSGWVTASHCSDQQGAVDGTEYYQPLNQVADEFIGIEIADPAFFRNSNGCPRGRLCRFSDANFSDRDDAVPATLGGIAKTTAVNDGSLEIADDEFKITSEAASSVGQTLNKVGRTTGWTQGTVTRTCVNTGVSGTRIVLLCQDFVENNVQIVAGGDSGSNVFAITGGNNVSLRGTLWGGNSSGTLFVYSPMANIERELGLLTTF